MNALARAIARGKKKNAQNKQQSRHWITSHHCCAIGLWLALYRSALLTSSFYAKLAAVDLSQGAF